MLKERRVWAMTGRGGVGRSSGHARVQSRRLPAPPATAKRPPRRRAGGRLDQPDLPVSFP